MSAITTHVLDTSRGRPASGVQVVLEIQGAGGYRELGRGATDDDGRQKALLPPGERLLEGIYRLTFHTGAYFAALGVESFYPTVSVLFEIRDPAQHHHVPLLLSPHGYTTYRGS
ncbi:5-hydroxyisourate hydrolase [Sorangium cellulosum]|uniref:5-hydroxyisourate hydrolase n=1 Tax=Sorangium cellulosum TaxID=56 RepID=A0A4V0NE35_SORCE|nr:hydroxyisourate hydrolase [Sorangium cellulosum]AUX24792.1 5-hydroxyisourate hydrolase [Sorangium cellulosum]